MDWIKAIANDLLNGFSADDIPVFLARIFFAGLLAMVFRLIFKKKYKNVEVTVLNHIVILANVFGIEATVKMIWYRVNKEHWPVIKPMLIYLNYIKDTEKMDVPLDPLVVERLRKI